MVEIYTALGAAQKRKQTGFDRRGNANGRRDSSGGVSSSLAAKIKGNSTIKANAANSAADTRFSFWGLFAGKLIKHNQFSQPSLLTLNGFPLTKLSAA